MKSVAIIGAGLSGCEVALQLASKGFKVTLYDTKPQKIHSPYSLESYAELVCNNSFGCVNTNTPLGLLLYELNIMDSQLISIANKYRVVDPYFYSVSKKEFSVAVTNELKSKDIQILNKPINEIPVEDITVVASGPLTSSRLIKDLSLKYNIKDYQFFDASSPVVDINTINLEDENIHKISQDLYKVSIPLDVFDDVYNDLASYEEKANSIEKDFSSFNKNHSIEQIAKIGKAKLIEERFSHDLSNEPSLLLRREHALESGFILVGCTTTMKNNMQVNVFSRLPGFLKCKFIKFGRMHRNTFINSPHILNEFYQVKKSDTYIIGQLSGVDGYAPCISSGLVAAYKIIYKSSLQSFPKGTMIGALANYISNPNVTDFQPMCASFSLFDDYRNGCDRKSNSEKLLNKLLNSVQHT